MITFPCLCGVKFSLPDNMAGGSLQCKSCGRLVNVPTLDELRFLQADGTYDVDLANPAQPERGVGTMHPADSSIDAGDPDAVPLDEYELPPVAAPRYDPFTGELVRAVDVDEAVDTAAAIAPPRVQPLNKSDRRNVSEPIPPHAWLYVFGQLLMAKNVAVILLMMVLHTIAIFFSFLALSTVGVAIFPVPVLMYFVLYGYYSLIVQETGPGDKDDLPTPMRHFEVRTDIWDPFIHFVICVIACFGPAMILGLTLPQGMVNNYVSASAALIGGFLFPAFFMTVSVDSVLANFRPDRVLGVVFTAKFDYLPPLLGWGAGAILLMNAMMGIFYSLFLTFVHSTNQMPADQLPRRPLFYQGAGISFLLMFAGLYLSYYGCWQLGLMWRKHYERFPWVAQVFRKPPPQGPPRVAKRSKIQS